MTHGGFAESLLMNGRCGRCLLWKKNKQQANINIKRIKHVSILRNYNKYKP